MILVPKLTKQIFHLYNTRSISLLSHLTNIRAVDTLFENIATVGLWFVYFRNWDVLWSFSKLQSVE